MRQPSTKFCVARLQFSGYLSNMPFKPKAEAEHRNSSLRHHSRQLIALIIGSLGQAPTSIPRNANVILRRRYTWIAMTLLVAPSALPSATSMEIPSPPASTGSLRRRNGRQQACEPCRKRKVGCDHTLPVCQRCRKRKSASSCIYIVSSETTAVTLDTQPLPSPATRSVVTLQPDSLLNGLETRNRKVPGTPKQTSMPVVSPGYLGFTSFCTVYEETRNSLSLVHGPESVPTETPTAPNAEEPATRLSRRTLDLCLTVLRTIPPPGDGEVVFLKLKNRNDGWMKLAALRVLQSLYTTFGHYLGLERNVSQLEQLSRLLCRNTAKPLNEDDEDPASWLNSFSGQNLRWDSLGILFTYWALGKVSSTTRRPEPASQTQSANISTPSMMAYKECVALCIKICRDDCGCKGNSLFLYIVHKYSILESITAGDASECFRRPDSRLTVTVDKVFPSGGVMQTW
jgi:Fungal Zn(2)-Cys(6) binuclear cluster domain